MQDYRKLRVWRSAFDLALNTRAAASRFPRAGFAELKAQMTSSAESIVLNIVEGCGAATQREFGRFLDIAIKSAMELEGQYELARGYQIIAPSECESRMAETIELRKGLFALRKKVAAKPDGLQPHPRPTSPTPIAARDQASAPDVAPT